MVKKIFANEVKNFQQYDFLPAFFESKSIVLNPFICQGICASRLLLLSGFVGKIVLQLSAHHTCSFRILFFKGFCECTKIGY